MKIGLGIIAKDSGEITESISEYYKFFDGVKIAVDGGVGEHCISYEWSDKEKDTGRLDFARKRNFLHDQFIADGFDFYLTIDTDDLLVGLDNLPKIIEEAVSRNIDIVYLPYHYSKDEFGNVNAIHNKERLIRCTDKIFWNMPIHENMLPKPGYQHGILLCDYMHVVHDIDNKHSEESYDRNIKYMVEEWNEKGEDTDPRTIAYLGRCFMAKKMHKEAIFFLSKHAEISGWDEDRCMTLCQLSDIYRELEEYDAAIKYAHQALIERDDFPEPYLKLHDIYTETHKFKRAIFWGEQGRLIKRPQTFMIVDPSYTGWRLDLSLSFCYMQEDEVEKAHALFSRAKKNAPDLEFIKANECWYNRALEEKCFIDNFIRVLNFIEKEDEKLIPQLIKSLPESLDNNTMITKIKNRYCDPKIWASNEVTIICGYTLDSWSPESLKTGIGGSEEAVIHIGRELTKLGYKVTVYNRCEDAEGIYDGVTYKEFNKLNPNDEFNIVIGWRSNIFRLADFKASKKYIWLHDVYLAGSCDDHSVYDKIIVLSEFHKSLLPSCIPDEKILVSANGINIDKIDNVQRNPSKLIYASSYDRGLENLLNRWDEIIKAVPEAELHIYYGWNNIDKLIKEDGNRQLGEYKAKMLKLLDQPRIYEHGRVGNKELHEAFASSGIWVYPSHFEEISCITAMKAQELGALPVVTDYAALAETVKDGVIVQGKADNKEVMDKYIKALVKALNEKKGFSNSYDFSWESVAKQWAENFND